MIIIIIEVVGVMKKAHHVQRACSSTIPAFMAKAEAAIGNHNSVVERAGSSCCVKVAN